MANQTLTVVANYDEAALTGLNNGETITINAGAMTINSDVRWAQNAAIFGSITISSTLGGSVTITGANVWEIAFDASSGNVPTTNAYGSNAVTGGTSGATGELLRVWATGSLTPAGLPGRRRIRIVDTPLERTIFVAAESRTAIIGVEVRTINMAIEMRMKSVAPDVREVQVAVESRLAGIEAEERTVRVSAPETAVLVKPDERVVRVETAERVTDIAPEERTVNIPAEPRTVEVE